MDELERIELATDKVSDYQKRFNVNQKRVSYIVGKNLTLFLCMLVPLLLIGTVWTEFGAIVFRTEMIAEGIVTVMLLAVGEILMTRLGKDGGKMDTEYLAAKNDFEGILKKVGEVGTLLLDIFCDWQIDVELEQAVRVRLRMLRMTPKMWEEVKAMPPASIEAHFGKRKAQKIQEIIDLKPIELNSAILLYNGEYTERGEIPESGDSYINKKSHLITTALSWLFGGLLGLSILMYPTSDVTFARVMYTAFKLAFLLYRMATGYDRGARAYNTVEVRRIKSKINYLNQYLKFIENKLYLKLGDKYGDISQFVGEEVTAEQAIS